MFIMVAPYFYKILNNLSTKNEEGEIIHEEWRDVKGFEGHCQVSSFGRVKSLSGDGKVVNTAKSTRRHKILAQKLNRKTGYLSCTIRLGDFSKSVSVHRLVALHFIPNPENKPEVNHKSTIKINNLFFSLEWNTRKENQEHAIKNGLCEWKFGEDNAGATLSNNQVIEIFKSDLSNKELSQQYGVDICVIYQIKNGKNWSTVTGKYYKAKTKRCEKGIILEIYNSSLSNSELGKKYGFSTQRIWEIKSGKSYKKLLNK